MLPCVKYTIPYHLVNWASQFVKIELEHYDDRGAAIQAEYEAIVNEQPVYNERLLTR